MNEQEEHVRTDEFLGEYKEQPYNRNQVHAGSRVPAGRPRDMAPYCSLSNAPCGRRLCISAPAAPSA